MEFPRHLLLEKNGHPAFLEILPRWLNRETRREFASRLRRDGVVKTGSTSSDKVLLAWFKKRGSRFGQFWRLVERYETEGAPAAQGTLSLDYCILEQAYPNFLEAEVEREVIATAYPKLGDLETRLAEDFPDASKVLQPLALWFPTESQLAKWQSLDAAERESVAQVVFALCGVTDTSWFFEKAKGLVPGFEELFESEVRLEQKASPPTESKELRQEWRVLWEEVKALGGRALDGPARPGHVDELWELSAKLEELREQLYHGVDEPESLDAAIYELKHLLLEAARRQQWPSLTDDVIERLGANWRLAQSANIGNAALLRDARRAIRELMPLLEDAARRLAVIAGQDELLRKLAKRIEETRLLADRRAVLEERNRAEEERSDVLGTLEVLEKQILSTVSPFNSPYDASRDYLGELTSLQPDRNKGDTSAEPTVTITTGGEGVSPEERSDNASRVTVATPGAPAADAVTEAKPSEAVHAEPSAPESLAEPRGEASAPSGMPEPVSGTDRNDDTFGEEAGKRCSPIWAALLEGNRALAYQIARALKQAEPGLIVPHVPLLQAVLLADHVQTASGRLAGELEELYSSFNRNWFTEGPLAWSQGLSLLLVSATLNPALIAPGTGASAVLRYRHLPGNLNSLYELCELLIGCGERLQGQSLNPGAFYGHKTIEAWNRDLDSLRTEVAEWKGHAPRLTMKFSPATAVWQRWQRSDGLVGRLLDTVQTEDLSLIPGVTKTIKSLQHPSDFTQIVTRTDRQELKRRRGDDIHAGALIQLRERAGEAVAYVQRWLELIESRPSRSDYLTRQLGELRQQAARLRPSLDRELADYAAGVGDGWSLVPAGVACVRRSIQALDSLFDGSQQIREPEPTPEMLAGSTLLLAPGIDVDESFRPLQGAQEVLECLIKLSPGHEDWTGAFKERLQRGDCDGAKRILDLPGRFAEADSTKLAETFRLEMEHHREHLRAALKSARDKLEAALAYGYIDEHERSELDAILAELERGFDAIGRFWEAHRRIEHVTYRIQTARDTKLASVKETYKSLKLAPGSDIGVRLSRIINDGDVLTANEYLARLKSGESLPDVSEDGRDVFSDFFPAKARGIDAFLGTPGGGLGSVGNLIKGGQGIAGLAFGATTGPQAKSAAEMIETWQRLKRPEKIDGGTLSAFLSSLGFSNPRVLNVSAAKSECEVQVEPVADRATCPVPQYGSQAGGHYRLVCIFKRLTDEDLVRFVSETSGGRATLVLYFGRLNETRRRELAQVSREKRRTFLVLDETLLLYLAAEPKSRLATFFHCTLPFTFVEPYITTSGLVPPEMFYGRVDELNAVREMGGRCFIYGGRQLGKTALLREAERSFHSPKDQRVARWIDLKAEGIGMSREPRDIWVVIQRQLKDVGVLPRESSGRLNVETISDGIRQWLEAHAGGRILLLLDEADKFLEQDSRLQYPETSRLKNLMDLTARRFKVVFAGLHNVLRTAEQANHPLAHLGDPIEIGPLIKTGEWRFARDLIRYPLSAAGYKFEPEDLMVRILAQTNYYPSLIQLYCAQLLRQLHKPYNPRLDYKNGPRYAITESVVDEAYRSKELRDAISSRFHLTLQLDPRYEVVTYAIAYAIEEGRFNFEEGAESRAIRDVSLQWWAGGFAGTSEQEFRVLLDEMVGLGVLRHAGERGYSLRNPNVLLLMGTREDIEAALLKEREQPQEFEPNLYRAQLPGDSHDPLRSPITFGQEHSLVRKENGVTVVAGSAAAGLEHLERFLKARIPSEFLRLAQSLRGRDDYIRQLELLERRPVGATTLYVVPQSVDWDADWVRLAIPRIERLRAPDRHVRVIFVGDPGRLRVILPELRPQIEGLAVELLSLKPWSDNFLRQWLEDIGITGADSEARRRLADATGLWPARLTDALTVAGGTDILRLCRAAEDSLGNSEDRKRSLGELGLNFEGDLRILRVLSDLGELSEEEFSGYRDFFEADVDLILRTLRWAEALQLAERSAARAWRVSPFVAQLLAESQAYHAK